jgi:serine/threonine protein kinase
LKTSSIKNEKRKALNIMLSKISDDLIDLIDLMLLKDPSKRIDILRIYEHPWIVKFK